MHGIDPRTHKPMVEPEDGSSQQQSTTKAIDDGGWDSWEMVPPLAQPSSPSSAAAGAGDDGRDTKPVV